MSSYILINSTLCKWSRRSKSFSTKRFQICFRDKNSDVMDVDAWAKETSKRLIKSMCVTMRTYYLSFTDKSGAFMDEWGWASFIPRTVSKIG